MEFAGDIFNVWTCAVLQRGWQHFERHIWSAVHSRSAAGAFALKFRF